MPAQGPSPAAETWCPACGVSGVQKHFGGVHALRGVSLDIEPGQVHAIVGENGAGKSTLMKILAGAEYPDSGSVHVGEQMVEFENVADAIRFGIATVFQELSLFPDLDVLANLFLLREPRRFGLVDRRAMREQAQSALRKVGLDIDLDVPVSTYSLGERQLIEISHALLLRAEDILILDEPNSALNATETERLFRIVRELRGKGTAVIYVSHRLEEVFEIADAITVMRNGEIVETTKASDTSVPRVVKAMIGRNLEQEPRAHVQTSPADPGLVIEGVSIDRVLGPVDIIARPGEVVGLAGLEGSGSKAIFDAVMGIRRIDEGSITLPSGQPGPRSVAGGVRRGLALVPSDRRGAGLALQHSVLDNLSQVTAGSLGRYGFLLNRKQLRRDADARCRSLSIETDSLHEPVANLSGGNQQKVVLGKWLEADPNVVLLDDPTRGVDVGSKAEIYQVIDELAAAGRVVLFSSSELPEYVTLCDRVLIFYRGQLCGQLDGEAFTEHRLLEAINTGSI